MSIIYEKPTKKYKPVKPQRYEVEWFMVGKWVHWSWHRSKFMAHFEVKTAFGEHMRIIDHGDKRWTDD